jgi:hypothetical protein
VVRQQDFDWHDQTGGPADPQAGNLPGGKRDVLRTASFDDGTLQGFAVDSGVWQVASGRLEVAAGSLGADAAAVFNITDYLPAYYEVQASISVMKPLAGWKANAYIIFDYVGATAFKFAGIDISVNKLVIGHRDATGWYVDVQTPFQAKADTLYNLLLSVNGLAVTLSVNNQASITKTYAPRVIDGYSYGLNYGFVGFGSDNSRGSYDNITVQVLPAQANTERSRGFDTSTAEFAPQAGAWSMAAGRYASTPAAGANALSLLDLGLGHGLETSSYVELEATVRTSALAGIAFDAYAANDFKFAALDIAGQRVVIGHVDPRRGFVVDTEAPRALAAGTDATLTVTLRGSTVSVFVGGQAIVSFVYDAAVTDGASGVFARGGSGSFDRYRVRTNDPGLAAVRSVAIADVSVTEGAAGAGATATLTLTLSQAATSATSVSWSTVAGTATAGSDYTARSGVATFAAGATTAQITIPVIGDAVGELDETFSVVLSAPSTGLAIGRDAGQVTIVNDDTALAVDDVTVTEGNTGTTTVSVTVRRSGPTTGTSTVVATTVAGTALAGSDFVSKTQTLTFAAGATTAIFQVTIVNNTTPEPTETFTVVLSSATGAAIADGTGVVTIIDTDGALMAAMAAPAGTDPGAPLTAAGLDAALAAAMAEWKAARPDADFSGVTAQVADLPGLMLGLTEGRRIAVDWTAAGWGWKAMDLRTVLLHELGHVLGLEHAEHGVMQETLSPGEIRGRLPVAHTLRSARRWTARNQPGRLWRGSSASLRCSRS